MNLSACRKKILKFKIISDNIFNGNNKITEQTKNKFILDRSENTFDSNKVFSNTKHTNSIPTKFYPCMCMNVTGVCVQKPHHLSGRSGERQPDIHVENGWRAATVTATNTHPHKERKRPSTATSTIQRRLRRTNDE